MGSPYRKKWGRGGAGTSHPKPNGVGVAGFGWMRPGDEAIQRTVIARVAFPAIKPGNHRAARFLCLPGGCVGGLGLHHSPGSIHGHPQAKGNGKTQGSPPILFSSKGWKGTAQSRAGGGSFPADHKITATRLADHIIPFVIHKIIEGNPENLLKPSKFKT